MVELVDWSKNCSGRCWWTEMMVELVELAGGDGSALSGGHLVNGWSALSDIASQHKLSY